MGITGTYGESVTTHREAKAILDAPGISPGLSLLTRAVSVIETHYGDGWREAGTGSHNWGAVTAGPRWEGDTFEHRDSRWDPKKKTVIWYTAKFRSYPSAAAGARDLAQVLRRNHPAAVRLAEEGRWHEVSKAMGPRGSRYYMGASPPPLAEAAHRKRLLSALQSITRETGELGAASPSVTSTVGPSIGGILLLLLAVWRSSG